MQQKLLTLGAVLLFGFGLTGLQAQNDTIYIMKSGSIIGQYKVSEVDSVIFYKPLLNPGNGHSGIVVKGSIPKIQAQSSNLRAGQTLSLSDATRVLVSNFGRYNIYDIIDGSFSFSPEWGTGIALLFLDANNQYIGNLSSRGLNLLPLGKLSEGENTVIDLSMLSLDGTTVIPSHDPLGNEIIISEEEINILKAVGSYYESIAKNIDADNDGVPDALGGTQLFLSSTFVFVDCGHWGYNDTVPVINGESEMFLNSKINFESGMNLPMSASNISFSGPAGDPYNDISLFISTPSYRLGHASRISYNVPVGFPFGEIMLPFKKGIYTLTLDEKNYTLDYSNNNAYSNLVLAVPTLHTNSEGLISSISLDYKLLDSTVVDPANLLTSVQAQIVVNDENGLYKQYDVWNGGGGAGPLGSLTVKTGFDALVPGSPIDIPEKIIMVSIWYQDLLGNSYALLWK